MADSLEPRRLLRALFDAAVAAADPARIVAPHLPPLPEGRLIVLGAGKASAAMAEAVEAALPRPPEGLVVVPYGHSVPCRHIRVVEAAHPVPDEAGWAAALALLDLANEAGPQDRVLALISGGGSALTTAMPPPLTLDDARVLNRVLLASGLPIGAMNTIRRHLSVFNGGRLAAAAHPAPLTALLISDVPGDDPGAIASGPTVGDPTSLADARRLATGLGLPAPIRAALEDPANESVKPGDPRLSRTVTRVIAAPMAALRAAETVARAAGIGATILGDAIEGEARSVARRMGAQARALQAAGRGLPHVLISGGETTVTLPDRADLGSGGRNVDFLLGLAEALDGAPGIWAIAGDTDGVDGAAPVAGAILTPDSVARAGRAAFADALARHDGHGFFARLGDQVITGPTLTNVNDFRAILVCAPDHPQTRCPA